MNCEIVSNVKIYGLDESVKASKYPMSVNTDACTSEITGTTMKLASCHPGEAHDNFLHGIIVQFDLTFSVKAWTEAERYHFFEIVSSQSTMHRITRFDYDSNYSEYTDPRIIEIMKKLREEYFDNPTPENYLKLLYSNPCGFKLTARISTNYCQLKTIYRQRKNHRLPEWQMFCRWIESLPHSIFITKDRTE